jgi:hypothetical protein
MCASHCGGFERSLASMTMMAWQRSTIARFRSHGQVTVARTLYGLSLAASFSLLWITRRRGR